ncbi:hypothetical protein H0H92_002703, partial [Tricholoma furcatifolium]
MITKSESKPPSSPLKSSQYRNINSRAVSPGPGQPVPKKARMTGNSDVENTAPENIETQVASQAEDSKSKRPRRSVGLPFVKYPTQPQAPLPEAIRKTTFSLTALH